MKITITGTFGVPRSVLEKTLRDAGHEVIALSKKTDILLVGEKTASSKKITKAEKGGIKIIREINLQTILSLIGTSIRTYVSTEAYVSMYNRQNDIKAGKTITVGVHNLMEVYSDFVSWNRDCSEWVEEDIERAMISLTGGNGTYIAPDEVEETLGDELGVKINPEKRISFLTGFYRLLVLDLLSCIITGEDIDCEAKDIIYSEVMSDEFYSKLHNLDFFSFEEEEDRNEALEIAAEHIKEAAEKEKDIDTVRHPRD